MASAGSERSTLKATPPPPWIRRIANPIIKGLLRSPLHGLMSKRIMLLTFTGRKSGKEFITPIRYARDGDAILCFTDRPWWKNLRGGAPATIRMRGTDIAGTATVIEAPEAVLTGIKRFLAQNGAGQAGIAGLKLDPSQSPTDAELAEALQGRVIIRIQPT
jgi:hypothetical protein